MTTKPSRSKYQHGVTPYLLDVLAACTAGQRGTNAYTGGLDTYPLATVGSMLQMLNADMSNAVWFIDAFYSQMWAFPEITADDMLAHLRDIQTLYRDLQTLPGHSGAPRSANGIYQRWVEDIELFFNQYPRLPINDRRTLTRNKIYYLGPFINGNNFTADRFFTKPDGTWLPWHFAPPIIAWCASFVKLLSLVTLSYTDPNELDLPNGYRQGIPYVINRDVNMFEGITPGSTHLTGVRWGYNDPIRHLEAPAPVTEEQQEGQEERYHDVDDEEDEEDEESEPEYVTEFSYGDNVWCSDYGFGVVDDTDHYSEYNIRIRWNSGSVDWYNEASLDLIETSEDDHPYCGGDIVYISAPRSSDSSMATRYINVPLYVEEYDVSDSTIYVMDSDNNRFWVNYYNVTCHTDDSQVDFNDPLPEGTLVERSTHNLTMVEDPKTGVSKGNYRIDTYNGENLFGIDVLWDGEETPVFEPMERIDRSCAVESGFRAGELVMFIPERSFGVLNESGRGCGVTAFAADTAVIGQIVSTNNPGSRPERLTISLPPEVTELERRWACISWPSLVDAEGGTQVIQKLQMSLEEVNYATTPAPVDVSDPSNNPTGKPDTDDA